jgi:hypothetical protein
VNYFYQNLNHGTTRALLKSEKYIAKLDKKISGVVERAVESIFKAICEKSENLKNKLKFVKRELIKFSKTEILYHELVTKFSGQILDRLKPLIEGISEMHIGAHGRAYGGESRNGFGTVNEAGFGKPTFKVGDMAPGGRQSAILESCDDYNVLVTIYNYFIEYSVWKRFKKCNMDIADSLLDKILGVEDFASKIKISEGIAGDGEAEMVQELFAQTIRGFKRKEKLRESTLYKQSTANKIRGLSEAFITKNTKKSGNQVLERLPCYLMRESFKYFRNMDSKKNTLGRRAFRPNS